MTTSFQTLLGNGYVNKDPATGLLSRFNDFARDVANQGNLDSQFEYRFATGPVQHKTLVGVDLKSYEISDLQAFDFATPPLNLVNPVYGVAQGFPANVFADQTITQKQVGVYAQDQLKLGRLTDWKAEEGTPVQGVGLRTFLMDDDAVTLLEWRQLEMHSAAAG